MLHLRAVQILPLQRLLPARHLLLCLVGYVRLQVQLVLRPAVRRVLGQLLHRLLLDPASRP